MLPNFKVIDKTTGQEADTEEIRNWRYDNN
jgi:hypothetical protein